MPYEFPTSLDDAERLLTVVGSFWSDVYGGSDLVASTLHARAQAAAQAHLDLLELLASVSRFNVPIFHTDNWYLLTLRESELNAANLPKWDGAYNFDGQIAFDQAVGLDLFAWAVPDTLVDVKVATNRITGAEYTLTAGVDFAVKDGAIWFLDNPFDSDKVLVREVFESNAVVDRTCDIWLYRGQWDRQTVFSQFGYALDLHLKSSQRYKDLVNAMFDSLVEGTSLRSIQSFLSAVTDVPVAAGDETVQYVLTDSRGPWVVTDKNAYGFKAGSTATVAVGDDLIAGQTMTNALSFHEFNRGEVSDEVRAMVVGRGFLADGYFQELTFENKDVPLVIAYPGDGYTRISFEVGGFPADVEKFWDDTHAAGVAAGQTLAMLLDQRPDAAKDTTPSAMALPTTINPLKFLIQNLFRENLLAVVVRPRLLGRQTLGLSPARLLRRMLPPHAAVLLLVELDVGPDAITMDGSGDEHTPGYDESVATYRGGSNTDEVGPTDITETVRCYPIGGTCK